MFSGPKSSDYSELTESKDDTESKEIGSDNPPNFDISATVINVADLPDEELDNKLQDFILNHKIPTLSEHVIADVSTIDAYFSIIVFFNAARRFPAIREVVAEAIKKVIYYRCTLPGKVLDALAWEAAVAGAEATCYTTTLVTAAVVLLVLFFGYQGIKYLFQRKDKNALSAELKSLKLTFDTSVNFLHLTPEDMLGLFEFIRSKIKSEKELITHVLKVYLTELGRVDASKMVRSLKAKKLSVKVVDTLNQLGITNPKTKWQRIVNQTQWYTTELGRYHKPIAALGVIPGLVIMVMSAAEIYRDKNCNAGTLLVDNCDVSDQFNMMSLEYSPWIGASFPVLTFHTVGLALNVLTTPAFFKKLRTGYYNVIHQHVEKWFTNEERWLYKDLGWEILFNPVILGILSYSLYKTITLVNSYAALIDCDSIWSVVSSVETGDRGDIHTCSAAKKSLAMQGFIGDFEIAKVADLYFTTQLLYYLLMIRLEKYTLRKWFTKERARELRDRFVKINKTNMKIAGYTIFIVGCIQFFIALRFANYLPQEGLEVAYKLNGLTEKNLTDIPRGVMNMTWDEFSQEVCPYANLTSIIIDYARQIPNITLPTNTSHWFDNIALPFRIENNNTVIFPLAEPCPNYTTVELYFLNLIGLAASCDALVEYRTLPTFIALFWIAISLSGGSAVGVSQATQLISWTIHSLKSMCCAVKDVVISEEDDFSKDDDFPKQDFAKLEMTDSTPDDDEEEKAVAPINSADKKSNSWRDTIYSFFHCGKKRSARPSTAILLSSPRLTNSTE
jgi:hypothetical protein